MVVFHPSAHPLSLKTAAKGSKGLMEQQRHHRKLLAAMLSQESLNPLGSLTPSVGDDEMDVDDDDDDDAMELLGKLSNSVLIPHIDFLAILD